MILTEHRPKNKRSNPDPLPRRHQPRQNQATQVNYGDSAHKNKKTGLFTAEAMTKCIEEVKAVETARTGFG